MIFAPLLLLAAAVSPASPVKQGVEAWQAGDYSKAVKAWTEPAAKGDADAQFNLAQAYKLGRGVTMDMRQAETWYRKAADQGHRQAVAMVGLIMFQNGDRKGALPFIRRAADDGDPRAQYVLGTALFNGDELPRDYPRAYAMMTKAAAAGLPQAQTSLRQMDQFIPMGERQAGLALAKGIRTAAAPVAPAQVRAPAPPPSRVIAAGAPPPPAKLAKAPVPVAATMPAAAARGSWRIQLGAFSDAAAARGAWTKLTTRPALKPLTPSYVKAGAITRLQAGPFPSRAAATRACKATTVAGCFAVAG